MGLCVRSRQSPFSARGAGDDKDSTDGVLCLISVRGPRFQLITVLVVVVICGRENHHVLHVQPQSYLRFTTPQSIFHLVDLRAAFCAFVLIQGFLTQFRGPISFQLLHGLGRVRRETRWV
jgi:hypothetical protein